MRLSGLHFLLTYQCTFECDHCFVWGSPWQRGTFTLAQIRQVLQQAAQTRTITSVCFEGGEPFLYYPLMLKGIQLAVEMGFRAGIVTNNYWATSPEDAREWLRPLAGWIQDLTISSDLFHSREPFDQRAENTRQAAEQLGMGVGVIRVAQPAAQREAGMGQLPPGESGVMFRGRAADRLAQPVAHSPWTQFTACPHENLAEPGRVHVDFLGNLHICQGLIIGNVFEKPLAEICQEYDPQQHPVIAPLLAGGPTRLAEVHRVPHRTQYADACHLCYETRLALRQQFPAFLGPDQMYGVP